MVLKFLTWLQEMKQHWVAIVAIAIALVVVIVLIVVGYRFGWTGFTSKTLWDWLQLLIVPLALAIGGFWLSQIQKTTEQRNTTDNQREKALQDYIDKMSELLLEKKLRDSAEEDEIRKIARVRTLTVLRRLDPYRKRSVVQFLYESSLIDKDKCIISLYGADLYDAHLGGVTLSGATLSGAALSGADLYHAHLGGATLSGASFISANLEGADLSRAILYGANLIDANLNGANLGEANLGEAHLNRAKVTEEQLAQAKSLKGATMPDGSKHS